MSGHSKWHSIKHKKAAVDAKRGKLFTRVIKELTVAARLGGSDLASNPRLRTAVQAAKDVNMPKDTMERAIKKGAGELQGVSYEEITYEGYGPGGVAFVIKCTTDNKQRSSQDVRAVLTKHGGNLAQSGAVAFQFLHAGQFLIARDAATEDALMELALEAGADDVIATPEGFELRCDLHQFDAVHSALDAAKIRTENAELAYLPTSNIPVTDVALARSLQKLHDALDELDDVQAVFSNEDLDEATSTAAEM